MKDYQIAMAVPVSDTVNRPKDGEKIVVVLPNGVPAHALYVVSKSALMFDVQPDECWLDVVDEEPLRPTHWLRPIPTDTPFIKWPDGVNINSHETVMLVEALRRVIEGRETLFTVKRITPLMTNVVQDVVREMHRQDAKWGAQRQHHPVEWLSILTEEVGEYAEAVNNVLWQEDEDERIQQHTFMADELVQIAAVAIQSAVSVRSRLHDMKVARDERKAAEDLLFHAKDITSTLAKKGRVVDVKGLLAKYGADRVTAVPADKLTDYINDINEYCKNEGISLDKNRP